MLGSRHLFIKKGKEEFFAFFYEQAKPKVIEKTF
jgi:hypothetical protein